MDSDAGTQSVDSTLTSSTSRPEHPLNCWWVAATVEEVGRTPIARSMLEQRLVMFRTSSGTPCALMDRCPHRWTPLSRGTIIGDEVVCPYHGFRFNDRGACTYVPTETRPPKALKVRSYPARDHGPFVWVWMGDPAIADPDLLPSITSPNDAPDLRIAGHQVINCGYAAIHENLADAEHPRYLHRDSFKNHRSTLFTHRMSGVMDISPKQVTFLSRCDDVPPSSYESLLLGIDKNQGIDSFMTSTFTVPGCFSVEATIMNRAPAPGMPEQVSGYYLWCSTPISSNSCHFWWVLTYDHAHRVRREVAEIWEKAIQEDIDVLEAIQGSIDWSKECEGATEILVASDRPAAAVRRILRKAVQAEDASRNQRSLVKR